MCNSGGGGKWLRICNSQITQSNPINRYRSVQKVSGCLCCLKPGRLADDGGTIGCLCGWHHIYNTIDLIRQLKQFDLSETCQFDSSACSSRVHSIFCMQILYGQFCLASWVSLQGSNSASDKGLFLWLTNTFLYCLRDYKLCLHCISVASTMLWRVETSKRWLGQMAFVRMAELVSPYSKFFIKGQV